MKDSIRMIFVCVCVCVCVCTPASVLVYTRGYTELLRLKCVQPAYTVAVATCPQQHHWGDRVAAKEDCYLWRSPQRADSIAHR